MSPCPSASSCIELKTPKVTNKRRPDFIMTDCQLYIEAYTRQFKITVCFLYTLCIRCSIFTACSISGTIIQCVALVGGHCQLGRMISMANNYKHVVMKSVYQLTTLFHAYIAINYSLTYNYSSLFLWPKRLTKDPHL